MEILRLSGDVVRNGVGNLMFLGCKIFGWGFPKFMAQFYKFGSPSNTWQSLVTIGPEIINARYVDYRMQ